MTYLSIWNFKIASGFSCEIPMTPFHSLNLLWLWKFIFKLLKIIAFLREKVGRLVRSLRKYKGETKRIKMEMGMIMKIGRIARESRRELFKRIINWQGNRVHRMQPDKPTELKKLVNWWNYFFFSGAGWIARWKNINKLVFLFYSR